MPLSNGYGVVIGTVHSHGIEDSDNQGRWPHYKINVNTPSGLYECVINLKSRTEVKIQYRDFRNQKLSYFSNVLNLQDGFHPLQSNSSSGALDHLRHNGLKDPLCFWKWFFFWKGKKRCNCTKWWRENGLNLVELMEYYLTSVERIYIFGEPYTNGNGLHNIHMNQGDPIGSSFSQENGIWQDGGVIFQYLNPEPRLSILLTKFETQSFNTDNQGKPI